MKRSPFWLTLQTKDFGLQIVSPLYQFSSVQSLSYVQLLVTPWTAECQAFLSIANSWGLVKLLSTESVTPSNRLILSSPFPPAFSLAQHQGVFI